MSRVFCVCTILAMTLAGEAFGAEKGELLARIDTARAAVEAFAAKVRSNETVVADIEAARGYIRRASQSFETGKSMFGFGGVSQQAEQEIGHFIGMADLNIAIAESRLAKAKSQEELAVITPQLNKVKAKVKRLEDRKVEMEKLRAEAARSEALAREVAQLKTDKALLVSQVEMLMAERKKLDAVKGEKADLEQRLEEAVGENRRLVSQEGKVPAQRLPAELPVKPASDKVPASNPVKPAVKTEQERIVPKGDGKGENPLSELVTPERPKASSPQSPKGNVGLELTPERLGGEVSPPPATETAPAPAAMPEPRPGVQPSGPARSM